MMRLSLRNGIADAEPHSRPVWGNTQQIQAFTVKSGPNVYAPFGTVGSAWAPSMLSAITLRKCPLLATKVGFSRRFCGNLAQSLARTTAHRALRWNSALGSAGRAA